MDLSNVDIGELTQQLRNPQGEMGIGVGKVMAEFNAEPIAFTLRLLDLQPKDHVLEIGFGPGEGIAEAARLTPNGYVAGIDHSQTMLEMAEQRNHRAVMQEHVELTLGSASELPYEDDSFDKLFAVNVFHFWKDPARELAECKRVLKSGGRIAFFLSHPSTWPKGFAESGVFVRYEAQDLAAVLTAAGFRNAEHHEFTYKEWKGFTVVALKP